MKSVIYAVLLCLSFVVSEVYANDAKVTVGDMLSPISLQDQFEQPMSLDANTTILLFSKDMKGGEVIAQAFEKVDKKDRSSQVIYFADISGMPSLIAKFIAIPKMKDYSFSLGLDKEGGATAILPFTEEKATILKLNQLEVAAIDYVDSPDELTLLLE